MKPLKKLKKLKVLVACPHNSVKNYCLDDYLINVTNLNYNNGEYDVLMVDNSAEHDTQRKITKAGVRCIRVKPKQKANQKYIAESQEMIRLEALRVGYDVVVFIEDDVFPPKDIIQRLLSHKKQVVGATYFIKEGYESHLMMQDIEKTGDIVRHTVNIDNGYDILHVDGKLKKVHSVGLGCIAIKKSVLEKITFRWIEGSESHSDSFFAADLNAMGINIYCDTSVICRHENSSWVTKVDSYQLPK